MTDADPEWAYELFFVRPRVEFFSLLREVEMSFTEDVCVGASGNTATGSGRLERECKVDEPVFASDPFDLTGAAAYFRELVEGGAAEEEALELAGYLANILADKTRKGYTGYVRRFLTFCDERSLDPFSQKAAHIISLFIGAQVREGVRSGEPWQAGTLETVRHALGRLYVARRLPDPFVTHPELKEVIAGFGKQYGRSLTQARAIRKDELGQMVSALRTRSETVLRNQVIVTVVLDPNVGIDRAAAGRLQWHDVEFCAVDEVGKTTLNIIRPSTGEVMKRLGVLNATAAVLAEGLPSDGSMPTAAKMCGVASLRTLRAHILDEQNANIEDPSEWLHTPEGPVLRSAHKKKAGSSMGTQGLTDIVAGLARKAGVSAKSAAEQTANPYTFDERLAMLDAAGAPDPESLRNITMLLHSWWIGTRQSEVARHLVGDLDVDPEGLGTYTHVRKQKGDVRDKPRFTPHDLMDDGNARITDFPSALNAWLTVYERWLGRLLRDDDPLYPNMHDGLDENGNPVCIGPQQVARIFRKAAAAAGIQAVPGEKLTHHGLRAGNATARIMAGTPQEIVARDQGRKSVASLQGYTRADPWESWARWNPEDQPTTNLPKTVAAPKRSTLAQIRARATKGKKA